MPDEIESGGFDLSAAMDEVAGSLTGEIDEGAAPPPSSPSPAPSPATGAAPALSPAPNPRGYPKTWKPDHASLWDNLPETHAALKDEALRREEDFHRGIEGYKTKSALGEKMERILAPFADQIRQYNIDPEQILGGLLQAQMKLSLGKPEERVALMRQVIKDFKIDPASLIDSPPGEQPYVDPTLKALEERLGAVDSKLEAENQRRFEEHKSKVAAEVQAFASDPKNDLFSQAAGEIATLMRADAKLTLAQAYEKAVWSLPETRKISIERQAKADAEVREKEERERAEKAAATSRGSTRTTPRQSSATAPKGTMDDTMRETLKEIRARA